MSVATLLPHYPVSKLDNDSSADYVAPQNILSDQISGHVKLPTTVDTVDVIQGPFAKTIPVKIGANGNGIPKDPSINGDSNWLQLNHVAAGVQEPMSGAKKLRKMLFETDELIVCPGVYDGLSARTAIELGFNAMYMVRQKSNLYLLIDWD